MAKAVFLDYTGTILQTSGPDIEEMMERFTKGASFASQQEAVRWWFSELGVMEEHAYQENFVPEEELCMRILEKAVLEKGLKEDLLQMQRLNVSFWMYAQLYSDVRYFFEQCTNPIYIITNNSEEYVKICLRRNGLHANAVISADSVRAYKPRRELFEKALATAAVEGHDGIMHHHGVSGKGHAPMVLAARLRTARHTDCRTEKKSQKFLCHHLIFSVK